MFLAADRVPEQAAEGHRAGRAGAGQRPDDGHRRQHGARAQRPGQPGRYALTDSRHLHHLRPTRPQAAI